MFEFIGYLLNSFIEDPISFLLIGFLIFAAIISIIVHTQELIDDWKRKRRNKDT